MESLYVCLFSNGHIKVGRAAMPAERINTHVDRVSCLGVTLTESYVVECRENCQAREQALIDQCCASGAIRHQREWFCGLEFRSVCAWAYAAAHADVLPTPARSLWPQLVSDLQSSGLTQSAIAACCDCDQTTISALLTGRAREPLHSLGESLLALHRERTQRRSS